MKNYVNKKISKFNKNNITSDIMVEDLLDVVIDIVADTTGHFLSGIGVTQDKD